MIHGEVADLAFFVWPGLTGALVGGEYCRIRTAGTGKIFLRFGSGLLKSLP